MNYAKSLMTIGADGLIRASAISASRSGVSALAQCSRGKGLAGPDDRFADIFGLRTDASAKAPSLTAFDRRGCSWLLASAVAFAAAPEAAVVLGSGKTASGDCRPEQIRKAERPQVPQCQRTVFRQS
jgi:hypothetical protein